MCKKAPKFSPKENKNYKIPWNPWLEQELKNQFLHFFFTHKIITFSHWGISRGRFSWSGFAGWWTGIGVLIGIVIGGLLGMSSGLPLDANSVMIPSSWIENIPVDCADYDNTT